MTGEGVWELPHSFSPPELNSVSDHILSRLRIADAIIWRPDEFALLPSFPSVRPRPVEGKAAFVLRRETINSGPGCQGAHTHQLTSLTGHF